MKITTDNHQQSFKALNINNLCVSNRHFIRKYELERLQDIGKNFDISLTSIYEGVKGYEAIEIDVKPLRKNLSFFKKFMRPVGRSTYILDENNSIIESANEAIANLCHLLQNHK